MKECEIKNFWHRKFNLFHLSFLLISDCQSENSWPFHFTYQVSNIYFRFLSVYSVGFHRFKLFYMYVVLLSSRPGLMKIVIFRFLFRLMDLTFKQQLLLIFLISFIEYSYIASFLEYNLRVRAAIWDNGQYATQKRKNEVKLIENKKFQKTIRVSLKWKP